MAKAKEVAESSKSKMQEALEKLNKSYGVGTVLALDSKSNDNYDVISSGSIGFDYVTLGVGGFVKGRLYELMGWEGTGKSTICGHAAAECQKAGGTVLYIDGEHAVDKLYFQQLGVDTTKMLIAQPSCGEEGFNIAMEMIQTDEIDLIIIDDFGMKTLEGQQQNDFEQIIDDRYHKKSIIIASQLAVKDWYSVFKNEMIAEACLDRIVHKSIRFELKGDSLRKKY